MNTLTNSGTKPGLLTYATTNGSHIHLASKHITSYQELPDNCILINTAGGTHTLKFDNSTEKGDAVTILGDALSGS